MGERDRPHSYRRSRSPGGELLTPHRRSQQRRWRWRWSRWRWLRGAIPCPDRVPEQRLLSPESCLRWRRRSGPVEEISNTVLGFLVWGVYVGERARSVAPRGAHITCWRGPGSCRATRWCGRLGRPLRLVFGFLERSQIKTDF